MNRSTAPWAIVARREVSTTLRSKPFLISTGVLFVALIAVVVFSSLLAGRDQDRTVAVVDAAGRSVVASADAVAGQLSSTTSVSARTVADASAAERAVRDGTVDAALLPTRDGFEVIGEDSVDGTLDQALRTAATQVTVERNAAAQDVDLDALQQGTTVQQRLLDPAAQDAGLRRIAALVFLVLFYVTALTFGLAIANSVTQEKESRVVEILVAAVPLRALLWGKVVGHTVLAVGQVVLLALVGVAALVGTGRTRELGIIAPALGWYVVFFVLGFVALSSFWAAAGSLAGRQQDVQSTTAPAQIMLFAPYIIAVSAGEGVKTVVSMLPVAATMLMPYRMAEGSVPLWQIGVGLATTAVAAVLMVRLGASVYERTLLRTGNKISFKEALSKGSTRG